MLVLSLTAITSYATGGLTTAFLLASVYAVQAIGIFVLSIWRGVGGRSRTDIICLLVVVFGLGGWLLSGDAYVGLLCSITADLAAYVPTVLKTWQDPKSETHWTYTLSVLSALCGLLADGLRLTTAVQIYFMLIGGAMLVCIHKEWILQRIPSRFPLGKHPLKQE